MSAHPTHGFTKHGLALHARTVDHLPDETAYQRFNKKIAVWMTRNVGTMTCFWLLLFFCICALPAVLFQMNVVGRHLFVISFMTGAGFYLLLTWGISTTFQGVCLPAIMVGQNIAAEASDARAAKQYEDAEQMKDWLNLQTQGGLAQVRDELKAELAAISQSLG